ncbi:hypothetical protein ABW19_dt0203614 [Dactylella cylindrospora]|nr:hypothetical protein ABW19_dt0203614 [Dactylella cylindrospora]
MERPWSAESVRFLQKNAPAEILDVHHPYVCYFLPTEGVEPTEPKLARFQRVMLSFAHLLLEIETGDKIPVDCSLSSPEEVRNSLSDVLDRQDEARGPYHLAIEGCLKFKASLASIQKREPKTDLDYQIRKVIYNSVIKNLEQNLSYFRNHKKLLARRNLQLADRSMKIAPIAKPQVPASPKDEIKPAIKKRLTVTGRSKYTVGWVCAVPIELAAVIAILDEEHDPLPMSSSETNIYKFGRIGKHNIAIACLPSGKYGTVSAATVACEMRFQFPDLRFCLMVGIGGGVPSTDNDIRLGDVVVGLPTGSSGGVVQYDFGKTIAQGKFERTGNLNAPPSILLKTLAHIQAINTKKLGNMLAGIILQAKKKDDRFSRPSRDEDRLFSADYEHENPKDSCDTCDANKLIRRLPRPDEHPCIHYGIIASGDQVMKHGPTRDNISRETGAICFEMEAAGLIETFPCLVVRGICDYSDSHKNKQWQPYATATAAAFAKQVLNHVPSLVNDPEEAA